MQFLDYESHAIVVRRRKPMQYKGYDASTTTVHGELGQITEVGYRLHKGDMLVQTALLAGPFDSDADARNAAEWAAREWIDQQDA